MGRRFQLPSGRVIALGRLMLATLFLCAIWFEARGYAQSQPRTLLLTLAYLFVAAAILVRTWNDWWADARLAGAAHALDIAMFTALVLLTDGYASPYFSFFMFLLLSAAIRWGWRATALTAALSAILYLAAGLFATRAIPQVELGPFAVRIGNMLILSLILIWFGIQWRPRFSVREQHLLDQAALAGKPLEASLRAAMTAVRAGRGAWAWRGQNSRHTHLIAFRGSTFERSRFEELQLLIEGTGTPLLYDLAKGHCLSRDLEHNLRSCAPTERIASAAVEMLQLSEGLMVPVLSGAGTGVLFLERVPGLSTDHLDLGAQVGQEIGAAMEQRALLRAAEEGAAARSRLALARDLHDSVVQFLAGAAFRLEAVRRAEAAGNEVGEAVDELKKLVLEEQGELRSFVAALRSGSQVALEDLATDLNLLASRLAKQWSIDCALSSEPGAAMIPTRIHLDAQQLVREAVANAVRHAGAKSVRIQLAAAADELRLEFINDGAAYPRSRDGGRMPRSLKERVEEAGGALELSRGMGVTKLSIALPIGATP